VVTGSVVIVDAGAVVAGVVLAGAVESPVDSSVFVSLLPQENENKMTAINQRWKELERFIIVVFFRCEWWDGKEVIRGYDEH